MGVGSSRSNKTIPEETIGKDIGTGVSKTAGRATAMASQESSSSVSLKSESKGTSAEVLTSSKTRSNTTDPSVASSTKKSAPTTESDDKLSNSPKRAKVASGPESTEHKEEKDSSGSDDTLMVSDLDVDVVHLQGSKYRPAPATPVLLVKDVFNKYKVDVASILHDEWRKPRLLPDGTYDPRPKEVAGKIYDIANLSFPDLPHKFQAENAEAADIACSFVVQSVAEHGRWVPEQLEVGSKQEHDAWMERNGSWAPPHQMLPYKDLSTEEKEKDRAIVLAAVDYLGKFYNKTIWADRSGDELPSIDLSNLRVPDHAVDNKN